MSIGELTSVRLQRAGSKQEMKELSGLPERKASYWSWIGETWYLFGKTALSKVLLLQMYVHYRIVFILTTILLSLQTSVIIALTQKSTFTFLSYTFTLMKVTLPTPLMIVLRQTNSPTFTGSRANSVKQQKLSDWTSTLRHPETPLSSQMSQMSSLSRLQNKKGLHQNSRLHWVCQ